MKPLIDHAIITGTAAYVLLAVAFLMMCADVYMDIASTKDAIKKGVGVEANPIMVWLMKVAPNTWPYWKAGVTLAVMIVIVVMAPVKTALALLIVLAFAYFVVTRMNYSLTR